MKTVKIIYLHKNKIYKNSIIKAIYQSFLILNICLLAIKINIIEAEHI